MKKMLGVSIAVCVAVAVSGCASIRRPVPFNMVDRADIAGMDDIRMISGESHTKLQENLLESVRQESDKDFPYGPNGVKAYPMLALSGGGANGAYGAGLLKGWSEEGSRPVFKVVTGVSTGAIMAPYVFLGSEYDDDLEKLYTNMSTKDVISPIGTIDTMRGDSLVNNYPLVKVISRLMDDDILAKVASEHKRGRRLLVGTVNLDAQRFVVWDMGAIAARGDKDLFRKVIVASAALPVIFPPSFFHVEADGKSYDEMHVDGGTLTQVFSIYKLLDGMRDAAIKLGIDPGRVAYKLYVIRNGFMTPRFKKVKDELGVIAERAFGTIVDAQGVGDIYKIYLFAKQRRSDFNLAFIPPDFNGESKEMFDPVFMKGLFDRGYADAVKGYKWLKSPPGMEQYANVPAAQEPIA